MEELNEIPVRTVCAMFGLNVNTLRTWERRYGFPVPSRGEGSHRLYGPQIVEQIGRIAQLTNDGMSVGRAIQMVREQVAEGTPAVSPNLSTLQSQIASALETLNLTALPELLEQGVKDFGYRTLIEDVAFPALAELGKKWEMHPSSIGKEHSLSMAIHSIVGQQLLNSRTSQGQIITLACCPGEMHQLPVMHLANILQEERIARPIVLVAGLPISETLQVARATKSRFILISSTLPPRATDLADWLKQCMEEGWEGRILLSGVGFARSRIRGAFPVRVCPNNFALAAQQLKDLLSGEPLTEDVSL